jgi:cytidine deaminase
MASSTPEPVQTEAPSKPPDITAQLGALLPDKPMVISASRAADLKKALKLDDDQLLMALVPVAKAQARPPISNFLVGAAGRAASGNIYLGVNLEFPGNNLGQTVHGEQFVVTNAINHGETKLDALAVSAAPCGHCRQWLNELNDGGNLRVLTPNEPPALLSELLPKSFGPRDLGITGALMTAQDQKMKLLDAKLAKQPVVAAALNAANTSYAPYSGEGSGVAVETTDGKIYTGKYAENAAFNPSLSPLQGALIGMVTDHQPWNAIKSVVLVERDQAQVSQGPMTKSLLASLQPAAELKVVLAEPKAKG